MTIGGDPNALRDIANHLRRDARDIEDMSARVRQHYGITWHGPAAERFREKIEQHVRDLGSTADETFEAARAVDTLAHALEERQRAIEAAQRVVTDAIHNAERTVSGLAGRAWDTISHADSEIYRNAKVLLDGVPHLPPPGSPGWLDLARKIGH
ncbi:hypothetical protein KEM60_03206 [Austwickia sp. TVS 96-490-7B]|nr:WXG100 family type VII secretion target [Austwickia sp. TVS 96-490-7B]MBW3086976.1 hypothetical protein [Austwickia sp. TVS 96-490-7B]